MMAFGQTRHSVFWDVTSWSFSKNHRFGGTYRLHVQGNGTLESSSWEDSRVSLSWRWRRYVSRKRWFLLQPHGVISRKTSIKPRVCFPSTITLLHRLDLSPVPTLEPTNFTETSVVLHHTTLPYISEHRILPYYRCENLDSYIFSFLPYSFKRFSRHQFL
jgi:hypothetical protein